MEHIGDGTYDGFCNVPTPAICSIRSLRSSSMFRMPVRARSVTIKDSRGVRRSLEVMAESLFEAGRGQQVRPRTSSRCGRNRCRVPRHRRMWRPPTKTRIIQLPEVLGPDGGLEQSSLFGPISIAVHPTNRKRRLPALGLENAVGSASRQAAADSERTKPVRLS